LIFTALRFGAGLFYLVDNWLAIRRYILNSVLLDFIGSFNTAADKLPHYITAT
jgi:hypothetical protein